MLCVECAICVDVWKPLQLCRLVPGVEIWGIRRMDGWNAVESLELGTEEEQVESKLHVQEKMEVSTLKNTLVKTIHACKP